MEDLVNNQDVKEIWFNRKSLMVPESNISSPNSGDISNGYYGQGYVWDNNYEDNDLPIYDKTYVVYSTLKIKHNTYEFYFTCERTSNRKTVLHWKVIFSYGVDSKVLISVLMVDTEGVVRFIILLMQLLIINMIIDTM